MATRDISTHEHAQRVRRYAKVLAAQAGVAGPEVVHAIETAALLHDIGKLAIPDRLLNKPGPLTAGEYEQVKQHAAIGADLLAGVSSNGLLALFVRHHHENWDGTGYPDGCCGDEIPIGARVLAITDCYDALTSNRPYRRALAPHAAIAMIRERRGSMFDPELTDAFLKIVWRMRPASSGHRPQTPQRPRAVATALVIEARAQ
jgi:HD-GYP domain-containing protein (c-di-GMP phosphodiesterase class II)